MNDVYIIEIAVRHPLGNTFKDINRQIKLNNKSYKLGKTITYNNKIYPISQFNTLEDTFMFDVANQKSADKATLLMIDCCKQFKDKIRPDTSVYMGTISNGTEKSKISTASDVFKLFNNSLSFNVSNYFNLIGRTIECDSACSSSLQALIMAYENIKYDNTETAICGGVSLVNEYDITIFNKLKIYSNSDIKPFNNTIDGTIPSDGCVAYFLCNDKYYKENKYPALAKIINGTINTSPSLVSSTVKSIETCITKTVNNYEIDKINAHATGTLKGDSNELTALHKVFPNLKNESIVAYKEWLGHSLAASGLIELGIDLWKQDWLYLLKNSFGLGGTNTSILLTKNLEGNKYEY